MRIALLALTASLLLVAPAAATTVSRSSGYVDGYKGSGYSQDTVTVTGAPGEANTLRVTYAGQRVTITDAGAPVRPGAGCVPTADGAFCAQASEQLTVVVDTGD